MEYEKHYGLWPNEEYLFTHTYTHVTSDIDFTYKGQYCYGGIFNIHPCNTIKIHIIRNILIVCMVCIDKTQEFYCAFTCS